MSKPSSSKRAVPSSSRGAAAGEQGDQSEEQRARTMRQYARMAENTLTVTDNRTGETFEVEITDGTVKAMDFRQMKENEDDFGLMTYDPAYTNTASCRSAITYIDGEAGVLEHRGIPIEDLCENSSYLEVAYLLVHGELPTKDALDYWVHMIVHHTYVHENIKKSMEGFRYDAHPMSMLLSTVGALSTFYPAAKDLREREREVHGHRPADREDAHARGLRVPPQARACPTSTRTTTSGTRATSSRCSTR